MHKNKTEKKYAPSMSYISTNLDNDDYDYDDVPEIYPEQIGIDPKLKNGNGLNGYALTSDQMAVPQYNPLYDNKSSKFNNHGKYSNNGFDNDRVDVNNDVIIETHNYGMNHLDEKRKIPKIKMGAGYNVNNNTFSDIIQDRMPDLEVFSFTNSIVEPKEAIASNIHSKENIPVLISFDVSLNDLMNHEKDITYKIPNDVINFYKISALSGYFLPDNVDPSEFVKVAVQKISVCQTVNSFNLPLVLKIGKMYKVKTKYGTKHDFIESSLNPILAIQNCMTGLPILTGTHTIDKDFSFKDIKNTTFESEKFNPYVELLKEFGYFSFEDLINDDTMVNTGNGHYLIIESNSLLHKFIKYYQKDLKLEGMLDSFGGDSIFGSKQTVAKIKVEPALKFEFKDKYTKLATRASFFPNISFELSNPVKHSKKHSNNVSNKKVSVQVLLSLDLLFIKDMQKLSMYSKK